MASLFLKLANCSLKNELNLGISSTIPMKLTLFEESHSSLQPQENKVLIRKKTQLFLTIKIILYFFACSLRHSTFLFDPYVIQLNIAF